MAVAHQLIQEDPSKKEIEERLVSKISQKIHKKFDKIIKISVKF